MIPELRVDGANQLARVSRALQAADPVIRRELAAGIREATEPLKKAAMDELAVVLPDRGGATAEITADTKVVTQRRGGRNPGVRLRSRSRRNARRLEAGILRHPLFGNRSFWFNTQIRPGWFSRPILAGTDDLRRELSRRLDDVMARIARSAR